MVLELFMETVIPFYPQNARFKLYVFGLDLNLK